MASNRQRGMGHRHAEAFPHRSADRPAGRPGGGPGVVGAGADAGLAARMAARDTSALAELFDRYGALAYGVALRVLRDPGRAEDAVQDAFMRLWHGASGFNPARGSLRGWVLAAVRNRAIDLVRGRPGRERDELELPAEQRQAVLLAYFGGYTQLEIAGLTGVPLSTVKGRMRLALDKLASYLKERGVVDV